MKKVVFMLAFVACMAFAACNNNAAEAVVDTNAVDSTFVDDNAVDTNMPDTLIVINGVE